MSSTHEFSWTHKKRKKALKMQMSGRINILVWLCKMTSSFPELVWLESCKAQWSDGWCGAMELQDQCHLPQGFVQDLGCSSSLFQNHFMLLCDSRQEAGTRRARLRTICPNWSTGSGWAYGDRQQQEKVKGRVWGALIWAGEEEGEGKQQTQRTYRTRKQKCCIIATEGSV